MTGTRRSATITTAEAAWLLQARGLAAASDSPLAPLAEPGGEVDQGSLHERGLDDPAWTPALRVLAAPDRQIRTVTPGPTESLVQVFYGSESDPDAGLVGCWPCGGGIRLSFPWTPDDVVAVTSRVVLDTPPPLAGEEGLTLSVGGLEALVGAVDAVRARLFTALTERQVPMSPLFELEDVKHQLEAGAEHDDARWLCTLLRLLSPPMLGVTPEAVAAGFTELAASGILSQKDDGRWTPQRALFTLAHQWRSPLPAVAHEVIETRDGEITRHDHRITVRGDGPLVVLAYRGLVSGSPSVSITSLDPAEYLDQLDAVVNRGGAGTTAEWVWVLDPVDVRGLLDTETVVGSLQPGRWYLLVDDDGTWARVADPDGPLEGWTDLRALHRRGELDERGWVATHRVLVDGLDARSSPDPALAPKAKLKTGVEVDVLERRGQWAHVRAENGWEAWVDAAGLGLREHRADTTPH